MGEGTAGAQVAAGFAGDLARHGDRPALLSSTGSSTGTVSYADLDRRVSAARSALEALTPPGTRHLAPGSNPSNTKRSPQCR